MKEKPWLPNPSTWKGTWRDDWRITGQEGYLYEKSLQHRLFSQEKCFEDFTKCEFCSKSFNDNSEMCFFEPLSKCWICEECFFDFEKHFKWRIEEDDGDKGTVQGGQGDGSVVS